jgi:hypothetical protein
MNKLSCFGRVADEIRLLIPMLAMATVSGCATGELANGTDASKPGTNRADAGAQVSNGQPSPWNGKDVDLVTVHVQSSSGPWQIDGALFDNGTIVKNGQQYAPGASIIKNSMLFGGTAQLRQGNEIGHGSLLYPMDTKWQRLPGPLVLTYYMSSIEIGNGNMQAVTTSSVNAVAGKTYNYRLLYSNGQLQWLSSS